MLYEKLKKEIDKDIQTLQRVMRTEKRMGQNFALDLSP